MEKVYVVAAKRSAIGAFNGGLSTVSAVTLGAQVAADALKTAGVAAGKLDEVIVGNILPAGCGQGVARQVAIHAGVPVEIPAWGISMACGSGMKAVMSAAAAIASGTGNLYLAGGTESMSLAPYLIPGARQGLRMGDKTIVDHMVFDALTDAFDGSHMGITAENIAARYGITRAEQDEFAFASQQKAIRAVDAGAFVEEITPVKVTIRREETIFDTDEYPNRKTSPEKLASLKPAFLPGGTVTAGNASGINDGAAFLVLASEKALADYNLTPLAEIVAWGQSGVEPSVMGLGPVPAVRAALKMGGLSLADIQRIELNEAFAAQSLGVIKLLSEEHGVDQETLLKRANPNGGAIALGHPVGASGARIIVTLLAGMRAAKENLGLASLCIGGGMGTAVVLKTC
ncbi:Acetyl-CoA acetyltransferase [bioreactor metagenome]|uniref:Acetyl-CoA acetyltransferase n=1 Tax=bioreactor metagenome TaxID=1076179 RepID=A0A644XPC7_9ZZZZ